MAIVPLSTKQFAAKIFRSVDVAHKAMAARIYKGLPLLVQQGKSERGGKPPYLVLWDTETNQPATGDINESNQTGLAPTATPHRQDNSEGERQSSNGRSLPTLHSTGQAENQNFGTSAKNHTDLTALNQPTTGEQHEKEMASLPTRLPSANAALAENQKTGFSQPTESGQEHSHVQGFGADSRSNHQKLTDLPELSEMRSFDPPSTSEAADSLASPFFGYSVENVVSITALASDKTNMARSDDHHVEEQTAVYQSASPIYKSDENPILATQTQTAAMGSQNLAITVRGELVESAHPEPAEAQDFDPETGEIRKLKSYPDRYTCQIDYVLELMKVKGYDNKRQSGLLNNEYYPTLKAVAHLCAQWQFTRTLTDSKHKKPKEEFVRTRQKTGEISDGIIPSKLLIDNAKSLRGRKKQTDSDVVVFFVNLVKRTCTRGSVDLKEKRYRTYKNWNKAISKQFGYEVPENRLATIIKENRLATLIDSDVAEQADLEKQPGFWRAVPTGTLWQMDGCVPESIQILDSKGGWTKFSIIIVVDTGSRYKLAAHAYYSESNATALDLMKKVFTNNKFPMGSSETKFIIEHKPDNNKGFLNLEFLEMFCAKHWAHKYRFQFYFKPAKPGDHQGKAAIEGGNNAVHSDLAYDIVTHFNDKKAEHWEKQSQKNGGNRMVMVTRLNITLDELNQSGVIQQWCNRINREKRDFREDGITVRFAPVTRWQEMINNPPGGDTFTLSGEDLIELEKFGMVKESAKVSNKRQVKGVIRYQTQDYKVTDSTLFSSAMTDVRISKLTDGRLAVFNSSDDKKTDGTDFLCYAEPFKAPDSEVSAHISDKKAEKIQKYEKISQQAQNEKGIFKLFEIISLQIIGIDDRVIKLRGLIAKGLTEEIAQTIISNDSAIRFNDGSAENDERRWNYFYSDATETLRKTNITLVRNTA